LPLPFGRASVGGAFSAPPTPNALKLRRDRSACWPAPCPIR